MLKNGAFTVILYYYIIKCIYPHVYSTKLSMLQLINACTCKKCSVDVHGLSVRCAVYVKTALTLYYVLDLLCYCCAYINRSSKRYKQCYSTVSLSPISLWTRVLKLLPQCALSMLGYSVNVWTVSSHLQRHVLFLQSKLLWTELTQSL
jgi:hypothetical protein